RERSNIATRASARTSGSPRPPTPGARRIRRRAAASGTSPRAGARPAEPKALPRKRYAGTARPGPTTSAPVPPRSHSSRAPRRRLVAQCEQRGVDEVVDVAQPGDRAAAVDQEHPPAANGPRDLADHVGRARPVDRRGAQDDRVEPARALRPADLRLGLQLAAR